MKIDGKWYHLDVTFDGGNEAPDYAYFNVPDTAKDDGSYPWNKEDFPECNSTDDCYICKNAKKLDSVYDIPERIKKAMSDKGKLYICHWTCRREQAALLLRSRSQT